MNGYFKTALYVTIYNILPVIRCQTENQCKDFKSGLEREKTCAILNMLYFFILMGRIMKMEFE